MAGTLSRRGWRTQTEEAAKIGPMLRRAGFVGSAADPVIVRASYDAEGRPRRVHARYPDGWTCTMHLCADRSYTLSQSLRTRIAPPAPADRTPA